MPPPLSVWIRWGVTFEGQQPQTDKPDRTRVAAASCWSLSLSFENAICIVLHAAERIGEFIAATSALSPRSVRFFKSRDLHHSC